MSKREQRRYIDPLASMSHKEIFPGVQRKHVYVFLGKKLGMSARQLAIDFGFSEKSIKTIVYRVKNSMKSLPS